MCLLDRGKTKGASIHCGRNSTHSQASRQKYLRLRPMTYVHRRGQGRQQ